MSNKRGNDDETVKQGIPTCELAGNAQCGTALFVHLITTQQNQAVEVLGIVAQLFQLLLAKIRLQGRKFKVALRVVVYDKVDGVVAEVADPIK